MRPTLWAGLTALSITLGALAGCAPAPGPSSSGSSTHPTVLAPASQKVVEEYLIAAKQGDGGRMYALCAPDTREGETTESLAKTAQDRYSPQTTWQVLKTDEKGPSSEVVVEFKNAKVDPNPTRFALSRDNGEWRIVDSPELHEREKKGGIHIKI